MKLAEALALRADVQKRLEQLRVRATAAARYQEGEAPGEDSSALVAEAGTTLDELEGLIRRINVTNASNDVDPGMSLTEAIARRDVLRQRYALYSTVADAATGRQTPAHRQMRSELRYVTAVDVPVLRQQADDTARELRELDNKIQQANWRIDLVD